MKVNLNLIKNMDSVHYIFQMAINILDYSKKIKFTEMVYIKLLMTNK